MLLVSRFFTLSKKINYSIIFQEKVQVYADKLMFLIYYFESTTIYWLREFKSGFTSVVDEDRERNSPFVVTDDKVTYVNL